MDNSQENKNRSSPKPVRARPIPLQEQDRIASIDVLRGFALLGVLLMNMQAFAMVFALYMNPTALGQPTPLDFWCWTINHVFGDQKFMTVFSMLFGAGIFLMTEKSRSQSGRSAGLHYRRMFWLGLFGFLHGALIWAGDILFMYAICGSLAWIFRKLWLWILVPLALILLLVPTAMLLTFDQYMAHESPEAQEVMRAMWSPTPETVAEQEAAYRGDWLDQQKERYKAWLEMFSFILLFGWRVLGLMLLGIALFRIGLFSASKPRGLYLFLMIVGLGSGLTLAAFGVNYQETTDWDLVKGMGVGGLFNYFGSLLAAFGYVGMIMLLCRSARLPGLQRRLAAVGRMAFTNYIMHSLICTTIFYGHGFGLFGQVNRLWQLVLVIAICALQLWYSPLWLERFRFGPLEWLWRSLTYMQWQPFRR
jgi:uncharacterized protein